MTGTSFRILLGLVVGAAVGTIGLGADETPSVVVAIQVRGTVEVQHGVAGSVEKVAEGRQLAATDIVTTAKSSSVVLVLENGSVVSLRENSRLKITTALRSPAPGAAPAVKDAEPPESGTSNSSFELEFGEMLARVRKLNPSSTFEVQTPVSVAAVRGTVFEVAYHAAQSGPAQYRLSTASGLVHVTPRGGALVKVAADEQMEFSARFRGKRVRIQPVKTTKLNPEKHKQLEEEARNLVKPAKAAPAPVADKPKDTAPAKVKDSGGAPRDAVKETAPDNAKPGAAPAAKKKKA